MPKDEDIVYENLNEEGEPLCPECKEEHMEYVDNPDTKDYWRCNWCGHVMPV